MSGYGSYGGGSDYGSSDSSSQQVSPEQMAMLQQQVSVQTSQAIIQQMQRTCLETCITGKPSKNLSSSEKTCLTNCFPRFLEALSAVQAGLQGSIQ
eukprot:m.41592 g.41592  ORF g.41592 m.41592 type:complete len:96 (+) comp10587_c1_seq2:1130-1417(+)